MEGRITICVFTVLIVVCFVQAAPKSGSKRGMNNLNSNKLQIKSLKKTLSRQGLPESVEDISPFESNTVDYGEPATEDGLVDSGGLHEALKDKHINEDVNENIPEDVTEDNRVDGTENYSKYVDAGNTSLNFVFSQKTRPYAVGDTFTPEEMYVIATCLFNKVYPKMKGRGKGIVSSAKNPHVLADRMFEGFFLTLKRIVVIREDDISGLDALQALALCGRVVGTLRSSLDSYTESPVKFKGDYNNFEDLPQKCHYKVISKKIEQDNNNTSRHPRRKLGHTLMKKLGTNRKLVVNPKRRGLKERKKYNHRINKNGWKTTGVKNIALRSSNPKPAPQRIKKKPTVKTNIKGENWKISSKSVRKNDFKDYGRLTNGTIDKHQNESVKAGTVCRWRYACAHPGNLYTCRLHSVCRNDNTSDIYVKEKQTENSRRFRKMVGIHVLDEELEKILENHMLMLRPQNLKSEDKKIESIAEYFNSIIASGHYTTPMPPNSPLNSDGNNIDDSVPSDDLFKSDVTKNQENIMLNEKSNAEELPEIQEAEDENAQARRILGLKS